jgi:hypothetical protein
MRSRRLPAREMEMLDETVVAVRVLLRSLYGREEEEGRFS